MRPEPCLPGSVLHPSAWDIVAAQERFDDILTSDRWTSEKIATFWGLDSWGSIYCFIEKKLNLKAKQYLGWLWSLRKLKLRVQSNGQ